MNPSALQLDLLLQACHKLFGKLRRRYHRYVKNYIGDSCQAPRLDFIWVGYRGRVCVIGRFGCVANESSLVTLP